MTRIRLREPRLAEEESQYYGRVYPDGYRHDRWPDHVERVAASVDMIRKYTGLIATAADLSCGDAAILRQLSPELETAYLGDLNGITVDSAEWGSRIVHTLPPGLLPDSLDYLPECVDLFVLSETLEHIPDPDMLLQSLKLFSRYLFLSTPEQEREDSGNLEHYWSWASADIQEMLTAAGWTPLERQLLVPQSTRTLDGAYHYQMWMAVAR